MTINFVVLKDIIEDRKAHKRDNCVSTHPALSSGIQLRSGRVFCNYSLTRSSEVSEDSQISFILRRHSQFVSIPVLFCHQET